MKKMKRFVSVLLTMVMTLAMAVPSFAAGYVPPEKARVTFVSGDVALFEMAATTTLEGYQLMTLTTSLKDNCGCADDNHKDTCYNYAYTVNPKYADIMVTAANEVKGGSTVTADNLVAYLGTLADKGDDIRDFADAVYRGIAASEPKKEPDAKDIDITGNKTITVDQGYWLFADITDYGTGNETVKSLVILDTKGQKDLTVNPKKDVPAIDKKISDEKDKGYGDTTDVNIGDNVYFEIEATVSEYMALYDTYEYVIHDTMSKGLTYNNDAEIYIVSPDGTETKVFDDADDPADYNFTITNTKDETSGKTKLTFTCADLKDFETELYAGANESGKPNVGHVLLKYSAKLNDDAVIGNPGNPNEVYLEYANNPYGGGTGKTEKDEVVAFTFELDVTKVDKNNKDVKLEGAEFVLYRGTGDDKEYVQVENNKVTGWTKNKAEASELKTNGDGVFEIKGLDAGTYYLEETKAPAGYNMLKAPLEIIITADYENNRIDELTATVDDNNVTTDKGKGTIEVTVENGTGSELPSTGGIGTTIFYVAGGIMVVGAAVLLVTKRRMKTED